MRVLLLSLLFATGAWAQGTGTLAGRVLESDGVTSVIGATVRIDGTDLGARTDIDGDYRIIGVPVGTYNVTASFVGLEMQTITGVEVAAGTTRRLSFALAQGSIGPRRVGCASDATVRPLFANTRFQARTLTGDDFERMAVSAAEALDAAAILRAWTGSRSAPSPTTGTPPSKVRASMTCGRRAPTN